MSDKGHVEALLREVLVHGGKIGESIPEGELHMLSTHLVKLESVLREEIQSDTSAQIKIIMDKLKSDSDLTADELEMVKLWLVGDAEYYINMENDYGNWINELDRLLTVIKDLSQKGLSLDEMCKISATTRDAIRTIGDIVFYKQQQERVEKFANASSNLTGAGKAIIADMLRKKLVSDEM